MGQNYLGFGDYTITGRVLDLGGGQPSAVAAHLVFKNLQANTVWIRHFVSSNTQRGSSNVTAKFLDVSDQITNLVPNIQPSLAATLVLTIIITIVNQL